MSEPSSDFVISADLEENDEILAQLSSAKSRKNNQDTRKSLAEYVEKNMMSALRETYFQRIIFICRHVKEMNFKLRKALQVSYSNAITFGNRETFGEQLTGLVLLYEGHSVHMVEGCEEAIAAFIKYVSEFQKEYFEAAKVVLVFNNMNQALLNKFIWKSANPPTFLEDFNSSSETDVIQEHNLKLVKTVYELCKKMSNEIFENDLEEVEDNKIDRLNETEYKDFLPDIRVLDLLLDSQYIQDLQNLANRYHSIPITLDYAEQVWPIPSVNPVRAIFNDSSSEKEKKY